MPNGWSNLLRSYWENKDGQEYQLEHSIKVVIRTANFELTSQSTDPISLEELAGTYSTINADVEAEIFINGRSISKKTMIQGNHGLFEILIREMSEYVVQHLERELARTASLLLAESTEMVLGGKTRDEVINLRVNAEHRAVRRRIPKVRPQMSRKERDRAISQILDVARQMENPKRTALANALYPRNTNPSQELRRVAKRLFPGHPKPLDVLMATVESELNIKLH